MLQYELGLIGSHSCVADEGYPPVPRHLVQPPPELVLGNAFPKFWIFLNERFGISPPAAVGEVIGTSFFKI